MQQAVVHKTSANPSTSVAILKYYSFASLNKQPRLIPIFLLFLVGSVLFIELHVGFPSNQYFIKHTAPDFYCVWCQLYPLCPALPPKYERGWTFMYPWWRLLMKYVHQQIVNAHWSPVLVVQQMYRSISQDLLKCWGSAIQLSSRSYFLPDDLWFTDLWMLSSHLKEKANFSPIQYALLLLLASFRKELYEILDKILFFLCGLMLNASAGSDSMSAAKSGEMRCCTERVQ